jgi:hypothetical protein
MADPQQADMKIEPYTVNRAWGRPQRRVKITLTRRAAYGYVQDRYTISMLERTLLRALGNAGYHHVTDADVPRG